LLACWASAGAAALRKTDATRAGSRRFFVFMSSPGRVVVLRRIIGLAE
jgi:hypothetical protein